MSTDIKAVVADLERLHKAYMAVCLTKGDCFEEYHPLEQFVLEHYPFLLAEIRRLLAMVEQARDLARVTGKVETPGSDGFHRFMRAFGLLSDNNAMARELDQASAKLVEQQKEIARLRPIADAAVSLREANEACQELRMSSDMAAVNYARQRDSEARDALFAALPPRKEGS